MILWVEHKGSEEAIMSFVWQSSKAVVHDALLHCNDIRVGRKSIHKLQARLEEVKTNKHEKIPYWAASSQINTIDLRPSSLLIHADKTVPSLVTPIEH